MIRPVVGTAAWYLSRAWLRGVAVLDRLHTCRPWTWTGSSTEENK